MYITDQVHLETDAALEQWTDQRVIEADDLQDLLEFWIYLPKVLSQLGFRFHGYQIRQRDRQWMLMVKVSEQGTPLVAFETSATPTGCIRLLLDQIEGERIRWNKDRYPWN